jgi:transposase-like protein
MTSVLSAPRFHDEQAAYDWVEARIWPNGPICPHCGGVERIGKLKGKSTRIGVYKCYQCRKPFTVKVHTVFESSHIPMHIWLQAMALMSSSKKGISTNQLWRILGVSLKAAWFMSHRIREAMRDGTLAPMGGAGGIVEADETYFGRMETPRPSVQRRGRPQTKRKTAWDKRAIISLVERGGSVRSFHVEHADKATVNIIVAENIARESRLHTDESKLYGDAKDHVADHSAVKHSAGEYVRKEMKFNEDMSEIYITKVHTNSVEGFFSILQARDEGRVPALWREAPSPLSRGV